MRIFFAIGLNERLCSRERFLCISEAGKMLVNEGVYVAERRSSCADCFLDLLDGTFRSLFFGAFYCFARLRTLLRTETSISSQIAGLPPSMSSDGSTTLE